MLYFLFTKVNIFERIFELQDVVLKECKSSVQHVFFQKGEKLHSSLFKGIAETVMY